MCFGSVSIESYDDFIPPTYLVRAVQAVKAVRFNQTSHKHGLLIHRGLRFFRIL